MRNFQDAVSPDFPVISDPEDVKSHLFKLDPNLTLEIFNRVIMQGQGSRDNSSKFDRSNDAGNRAHSGTMRALREQMTPFGWQPDKRGNIELTSNLEIGLSIVVWAGDKGTGIDENDAQTKNPKGKQTDLFVCQTSGINSDLFYLPKVKIPANLIGDYHQIWALLYYFDNKNKVVRSELSLPKSRNSDGYVNSWKSRLILSEITLGVYPIDPIQFKQEYTPDIDIPIERLSK
jgi:hypothetical protein